MPAAGETKMNEKRVARLLREMRCDGVAGFFERLFGLDRSGGPDDEGGKRGGAEEIAVEPDVDAIARGR